MDVSNPHNPFLVVASPNPFEPATTYSSWSDFVREVVAEDPVDVGDATQPLLLSSERCGSDIDDLSKLVMSCNARPASGISDSRPGKRSRMENQETNSRTESGISDSRPGKRSRTENQETNSRTENQETNVVWDNIQVCPEKHSMGNVGLIDRLTEHDIVQHMHSLEKASKEGDDCRGGVCQLCGMNKLMFNPLPIWCACCSSSIKRNSTYHWASDDKGEKHYFCGGCFKTSRGIIAVQGLSFRKSEYRKEKHIEVDEETWVQCDKCENWQHQICGLYNSENDYICMPCRLQEIRMGEHVPRCTPFRAKDLPCTKLSDHIEKRLQRRLKEERLERAISSGRCVGDVPGAENLVVRVVVSVNKLVKVKQQFLDIFHGKNYPAEFPYKSKMILLFQKIQGVDVCLFAMYVQEYGSDCPPPNQRSIHIAYIDSVNHFQPQIRTLYGEALRTLVYHEILIGYLDYCKKSGFETCYIWSCPPQKCEDFILNCHPESQKTPDSDKLRKWYKSMLLKATEESIVVDITNLYDRYFVPNGSSKVTTANLPYFDGAYWVRAAEEMYTRFDMTKNRMSKRTLRSMGHTSFSGESKADILVMHELGEDLFRVKENFMMVHLQWRCSSCRKFILTPNHWVCDKCKGFRVCPGCINMVQGFSEKTHFIDGEQHMLSEILVSGVPENTDDEDVILANDLFENRNSFWSLCQKNHYQFDSLRHAKYSSMMVLHHLHKHEPTQRSCVTDRGTSNKQLQKREEILKTLVHALQCKHSKENPCSYPKCWKLRNLLNHTSQCKLRVSGGCQLCKTAWALLHLHSRTCKVADCQVQRCQDIKMSRNLKTAQADNLQKASFEGG